MCPHIKHLSVSKSLKSFVDILFLLLAMLRISTCGNYNNSKQFTVWPKVSHLHMIYWWITCASLSSTSSINVFLSCSGTEIVHPFLAWFIYGLILNSRKTQDSYPIVRLLRETLIAMFTGRILLRMSFTTTLTVCFIKSSGRKFFLLLVPGSVTHIGNWAIFTSWW